MKRPARLLALAGAIRLAAWLAIPDTRFASDEDSYYVIAGALLEGRHDVFWPPVTGWLIALIRALVPGHELSIVRLVWAAMDVCCVAMVAVLSSRFAETIFPESEAARARLTWLATLGYAVYVPAISHSQFATSETPSLLQLLAVMVLLTRGPLSIGRMIVAGFVTGTLVLTRPNLLPLVITLPAAILWSRRFGANLRGVVAYATVVAMILGAQVYRTYLLSGEATLSTNSAYNLYIGNRDLYAEDLNLFRPAATPAQIEFRRQQFAGTLVYPSEAPSELQRQATQWIIGHPAEFARRALGRLARLFAPKTDALELIGGQQARSVFSPPSLLLLGIVNAQWILILACGFTGLLWLRHRDPGSSAVLGSVIAGAVPLCLIAISKPRYSFVFDPILLMAAVPVLMHPKGVWRALASSDRWILLVAGLFLAWAWVAWAIFAVTSRAAM